VIDDGAEDADRTHPPAPRAPAERSLWRRGPDASGIRSFSGAVGRRGWARCRGRAGPGGAPAAAQRRGRRPGRARNRRHDENADEPEWW